MTASLVLMTGDQRRHAFVANRLARHFALRGVVVEPVAPVALPQDAGEAEVIRRHFAERDSAEERFFAGDERIGLASADVLRIAKGEANSDSVYEWIVQRKPDFLVLFGSSLIRQPLLDAFAHRCINMHLGLSPYYRGSGTNFWPLVNRQPELVGVTIHVPTQAIDGGPILAQVRPLLQADDRSHDIGCKAIDAGAAAMISSLQEWIAGRRRPVEQQGQGRLYRRGDFTAEAVRTLWRQLDSGMIAEYLSAPERAGRYPIIA